MLDDNECLLEATLSGIMYIPGLSRYLFPITKFVQHGHHAVVKYNAAIVFCGLQQAPVTILVQCEGNSLAADLRVDKNEEYHAVP